MVKLFPLGLGEEEGPLHGAGSLQPAEHRLRSRASVLPGHLGPRGSEFLLPVVGPC